MHPNRTLLIIKRKARSSDSVASGQSHGGTVDTLVHQTVPSPESEVSQNSITETPVSSDNLATRKSQKSRKRLIGPRSFMIKMGLLDKDDKEYSGRPNDESSSNEEVSIGPCFSGKTL